MSFEKRINYESVGRYDITPIFRDPAAFADLLDRMAEGLRGQTFELIAGIDALGFVIGAALAQKLEKGFLVVRKGGKLPVKTTSLEFKDYSGQAKKLEIALDTVPAGAKILIVDDWIETGSQVRSAIELIEGQRGQVTAIAAIRIDKPGAQLGFGNRFCLSLL